MLLGKVWYFFYFGGVVCVWPYLNLLYRANGLNDAQIGVLAAVKPWVSAPSSFVWSGLADRYSAHKAIMIVTFIVSTLTRSSVSVCHTFSAFLVLAVLGECLAAPCGVMADAAVVAACKRDTDYGKSRLWGAVAWGSLSAFSGAMVSRFGMSAGFLAYVLLSVPCVYCAWHMEFKLGAQHHQQQQQQQQQQQGQQLQGTDHKPWQVNQQQQQQQLGDESCHDDLEQQHLLVQLQHSTAVVPGGVNNSSRDSSSSMPGPTVQADIDQLKFAEMHQRGQQPVQQQQQQQIQQRLHSQQQQQQQQGLQIQSSGSAQEDATCVLLLDGTEAPHSRQLEQQQGQQQRNLKQQQQQDLDGVKVDCSTDVASNSATPVSGSRRSTASQLSAQQQGDQSQQQQQHQDHHQQPVDFWRGLQQLLSRPAVLIFMWQATVMGFGIGVIEGFLFLFLQELGGSETLMGLTLTVTCVAEVPVFHYQDKILKHISVHSMLHVVLWTYTLRLGLYALLPHMGSAWAVLPIELLHGITFGCGWSAGTITSKRVSPPELAATMQGIFQGLYFGVGQGLGALIGGLLKRRFGGQAMFGMCAGIVLAGWVVCVVAELATARSSSSTAQPAGSGAGNSTEEQQQQQQQGHQQLGIVPAGVSSWVCRLRAAVSRALSRGGSSSADGASDGTSTAAAARRQLKHTYAELASKDSGPDLTLADTLAFGDRLVARAAV